MSLNSTWKGMVKKCGLFVHLFNIKEPIKRVEGQEDAS